MGIAIIHREKEKEKEIATEKIYVKSKLDRPDDWRPV